MFAELGSGCAALDRWQIRKKTADFRFGDKSPSPELYGAQVAAFENCKKVSVTDTQYGLGLINGNEAINMIFHVGDPVNFDVFTCIRCESRLRYAPEEKMHT